MSEFFFKFNNYLFSTGTATKNKLGDSIPVASAFLGLKVPVFQTVHKLRANPMTQYIGNNIHIFQETSSSM